MIPIDNRSKIIVDTVVFITINLLQAKVLDMSSNENDAYQKAP
jgi:hypothetical protein